MPAATPPESAGMSCQEDRPTPSRCQEDVPDSSRTLFRMACSRSVLAAWRLTVLTPPARGDTHSQTSVAVAPLARRPVAVPTMPLPGPPVVDARRRGIRFGIQNSLMHLTACIQLELWNKMVKISLPIDEDPQRERLYTLHRIDNLWQCMSGHRKSASNPWP